MFRHLWDRVKGWLAVAGLVIAGLAWYAMQVYRAKGVLREPSIRDLPPGKFVDSLPNADAIRRAAKRAAASAGAASKSDNHDRLRWGTGSPFHGAHVGRTEPPTVDGPAGGRNGGG